MTEPRWVSPGAVLAIHAALIEEHGGMPGLRDAALLESALARPAHKLAYGEADLSDLAAAYGFGLSRNHPFHDGNKRVSLVVVDVFLQLDGMELDASEEEATVTFRELAAGRLEEDSLARWIREHSKRMEA